jgi:hypothetical protein
MKMEIRLSFGFCLMLTIGLWVVSTVGGFSWPWYAILAPLWIPPVAVLSIFFGILTLFLAVLIICVVAFGIGSAGWRLANRHRDADLLDLDNDDGIWK